MKFGVQDAPSQHVNSEDKSNALSLKITATAKKVTSVSHVEDDALKKLSVLQLSVLV